MEHANLNMILIVMFVAFAGAISVYNANVNEQTLTGEMFRRGAITYPREPIQPIQRCDWNGLITCIWANDYDTNCFPKYGCGFLINEKTCDTENFALCLFHNEGNYNCFPKYGCSTR